MVRADRPRPGDRQSWRRDVNCLVADRAGRRSELSSEDYRLSARTPEDPRGDTLVASHASSSPNAGDVPRLRGERICVVRYPRRASTSGRVRQAPVILRSGVDFSLIASRISTAVEFPNQFVYVSFPTSGQPLRAHPFRVFISISLDSFDESVLSQIVDPQHRTCPTTQFEGVL